MYLPNEAWSLQNAQAQNQRIAIATLWLAAPTDLLENLWASSLGEVTSQLVRVLTDDSQLAENEIQYRNAINEQLGKGLQQPLASQMLLANFLFSPVGKLKIQNPEQNLPAWFVAVYKNLYESEQSKPLQTSSRQQVPVNPSAVKQVDLNLFPDNLQELVSNKIQLNRMLGLANLHYIDPEDEEILAELVELRTAFANAIKNCPENLLENIWVNHISDRYWAIVRSGIQKQTLSPQDSDLKQAAVAQLSPAQGGGFDKPGAINALLISMLYFEPGTMTVNDPDQNIPGWLIENFREVFIDTTPANS